MTAIRREVQAVVIYQTLDGEYVARLCDVDIYNPTRMEYGQTAAVALENLTKREDSPLFGRRFRLCDQPKSP